MLSPRATKTFPCSPAWSALACTPSASLGAIAGPFAAGCPTASTTSKIQIRYVTTLGGRSEIAVDPNLLRLLCQPRPLGAPANARHALDQSRLQGGDHLSQGPNGPVWTVGHAKEFHSRFGQVLGRLPPADRQRARLADDGARGLHLRRVEPGAGEQRSQHPPVAGRAALERHQRRQRLLAVLQVATERLTGFRDRPPDAKDVVDHLERQAKVAAEPAGFLE